MNIKFFLYIGQMNNQEILIKTVQEWVQTDNEIRTLKSELNKRNKVKKEASAKLMNIMKQNDIDCFDLKDGQLSYTQRNIKKPITKKMLVEVLSKYYHGDISKALEVKDFIDDNREEYVKETIERKINK
jgi:hypothetical protein